MDSPKNQTLSWLAKIAIMATVYQIILSGLWIRRIEIIFNTEIHWADARNMQKREFLCEVGGKTLSALFTDLADQTNGSVMFSSGDTTVLATVVMSAQKREGTDFFPLTVDYEEKFYAAGEILGSRFMRREGRPSDEAVLSGRVIDRTIRPLFDQTMRNDVQVVITVLSLGAEDPDILAVNAASLALATSDIPWSGPVSAVRIVRNGGTLIINPTYAERVEADMELTVSGKDGKINMIEAGANQVTESEIGDTLTLATEELEKMQEFQKKIVAEIGKEKLVMQKEETPKEAGALFAEKIAPRLYENVFAGAGNKTIYALKKEWLAFFTETFPGANKSLADDLYEEEVSALLHKEAVENNKRADGRAMDEVRSLYAQAGGISKVLHGMGIFYRGGTHVLSALTLGGPRDALLLDGMEVQGEKRFIHHYNFPPFSSGETGRMGGMNRRMIGHGALAERALSYIIPPKAEFPYTIRIVSESMASNGSTSMASVCGGTLALMDAGVPIKAPAAGIAIGLMTHEDGRYAILTDIQGPEDHHGDMDFKVAGTANGVTAIQMDIKVDSIPVSILREALEQAKKARLEILKTITDAIPAPRPDISPSAPKIIMTKVLEDQIGLVIGPGGKTIKKIKDETGVDEIEIEDDGTVYITGKNGTAEKARDIIFDMTRQYKPGERFEGEVIKLFDFGALVKINHSTEGLVHISELAPFRIGKVTDVVSVGDVIPVVVREVDERGVKFSLKDADPEYAARKGAKAATGPLPAGGGPHHRPFKR